MKTNKAPEKIYVKITHPISDEYTEIIAFEDGDGIEYTRTDAFIKKACKWIETNMDDYIYVVYDTVTGMPTNEAHIAYKKVVEDFKNYMKIE